MTQICRHVIPQDESAPEGRALLLYFHAHVSGREQYMAIFSPLTRSNEQIADAVVEGFKRTGATEPLEFIDAPETCQLCRPSPDGDGHVH